jgi:hypothetical protein
MTPASQAHGDGSPAPIGPANAGLASAAWPCGALNRFRRNRFPWASKSARNESRLVNARSTDGVDHARNHPQRNLPRISQEFRGWHAQAPSRWLKLNIMRDQNIVPYFCVAIGIAVAISVTMGSPPRVHPATAIQFAGPPSFGVDAKLSPVALAHHSYR